MIEQKQVTTYLVTISYDGSSFFGWSKQPKLRTVEGEINRILSKIFHSKIVIDGASRTDAKVHAYDQKFVFSLEQNILPDKILNILQHNFQDDIKVISVVIVTSNYDLRKHIKTKEYHYIINNEFDPFLSKYEYFYPKQIDISKLQTAFSCFVGNNYFYNFSGLTPKDQKAPYRSIEKIVVTSKNNKIIIAIVGNGFLRYQIRLMVSAALKYCEGKITLFDIKYYLKPSTKNKYPLPKVPASGLYLYKIIF